MVGVDISLYEGNFELDLTTYLFYKCITAVVSTILVHHMYGRWFIV